MEYGSDSYTPEPGMPQYPRLSETIAARAQTPPAVKALGFTRYLLALALHRGDAKSAAYYAAGRANWRSAPHVLEALNKAAESPGTTTGSSWAKPLAVQGLAAEFLEFVRTLSVLDRIPGTRRLPLLVNVPRQTAAVIVNWTGENTPKPAGALAFDSIKLDPRKVAGIVVITAELARFASLDAEKIVRDDLAVSIASFTDQSFLDGAAGSATRPASILDTVTPIPSVDLATDVAAAIGALVASGSKLRSPCWITTPEVAAAGAAQQTVPTLPTTLSGYPVLQSADAPAASLVLVDGSEIIVGGDDLNVSASSEGAIEMSDAPDGTVTVVDLWQSNLIGFRAERTITWLPAHATAASAAIIDSVAY